MSHTLDTSNKTTSASKALIDQQQQESTEQIEYLQREIAKLSSQLKEVIRMNTHWQRYDSQREEYVLKLAKTNQELQDRVSDAERHLQEHCIDNRCEMKKENNFHDKKHKEGLRNGNSGDDRPGELKASSDLCQGETITALTQQINKLKEKNQELENRKTSTKGEDEKDVQITMLREQVNVCVEDFKQERKDRERIHSENGELKKRLAQAEQRIMANEEQIYVYQEKIKQLQGGSNFHQVSRPVPTNGYDEPCCYPHDRLQRQMIPSQRQYTYRRPFPADDDLTNLPRDVEVDGFHDNLQDQTDGGLLLGDMDGTVLLKEKDEEPLECPRCLATFGINKHADLINHINKCLQ